MEERSFCVYARGTPFIPRRITWSLLRLTPGTIIQPVSHSRSFFECPRNFVKDQFASVLPLSWLRRTPGNYFTRPCNVRPRHRSSLTLQCLSSASLLLPPISTGAVRWYRVQQSLFKGIFCGDVEETFSSFSCHRWLVKATRRQHLLPKTMFEIVMRRDGRLNDGCVAGSW